MKFEEQNINLNIPDEPTAAKCKPSDNLERSNMPSEAESKSAFEVVTLKGNSPEALSQPSGDTDTSNFQSHFSSAVKKVTLYEDPELNLVSFSLKLCVVRDF